MKNIKAIIISAIFIFTGMTAFAQGRGILNFQWDMGFGLGNTHNFVSAPSFRGINVEGNAFVTNYIAVGGRFEWQTFYKDYGKVTRINGTNTITGYNKKYINVMPLMATINYYFTKKKIYSYVGLGLGTYYMNLRNQMGMYYVSDETWHFGFSPDVGVVIPLGRGIGASANFRYNYAVKTEESKARSWIGIGLGLSYIF